MAELSLLGLGIGIGVLIGVLCRVPTERRLRRRCEAERALAEEFALKQAQERAGAERTAYLHGFGVGRAQGMQEGFAATCPRQPRNSKGQFVKATESK